jgi:hypothetical protein
VVSACSKLWIVKEFYPIVRNERLDAAGSPAQGRQSVGLYLAQ